MSAEKQRKGRRCSLRLKPAERQIFNILLDIARKKNPGQRVTKSAVVREIIFGGELGNPFSEQELALLPYHPVNMNILGERKKGAIRHPSAPNVLIFWHE